MHTRFSIYFFFHYSQSRNGLHQISAESQTFVPSTPSVTLPPATFSPNDVPATPATFVTASPSAPVAIATVMPGADMTCARYWDRWVGCLLSYHDTCDYPLPVSISCSPETNCSGVITTSCDAAQCCDACVNQSIAYIDCLGIPYCDIRNETDFCSRDWSDTSSAASSPTCIIVCVLTMLLAFVAGFGKIHE